MSVAIKKEVTQSGVDNLAVELGALHDRLAASQVIEGELETTRADLLAARELAGQAVRNAEESGSQGRLLAAQKKEREAVAALLSFDNTGELLRAGQHVAELRAKYNSVFSEYREASIAHQEAKTKNALVCVLTSLEQTVRALSVHGPDAFRLAGDDGWWKVAQALDLAANGYEVMREAYAQKERLELVKQLIAEFSR